jgi:SH3-like domain-containing protein
MHTRKHVRQVWWRAIPLVGVLLLGGCFPEPEPAIDQATVLSDHTSVRIDSSSSARTLFMLDAGDRVDILSKEDSWYLIRDVVQIEGWMDESTLIRDSTRDAMQTQVIQARDLPVQNTAQTSNAVNLRMAPGRGSDVVRRLRRGVELQVLDHATTPRPGTQATDIWFRVRPSEDEVGWVFSQLIEFDAPEAIQRFMEGRTYTATQRLKTVEDPEAGPIDWWVVAERRDDADPQVAFDGVRVFIWNLEEHQYETTLRLRNQEGLLPLERTGDEANPGFRFRIRGPDGEPVVREYVMRGTLPRAVR